MRRPAYVTILLFAATSRLIARVPPSRLERLFGLLRLDASSDASAVDTTIERVERVIARSEPILRHTCLTRSLTRYFFFRRAGAEVQLVFGVGEVGGDVTGHCWLIRDSRLYAEDDELVDRFTPMWRIPGGAA